MAIINAIAFSTGVATVTPAARMTYKADASSAGIATVTARTQEPKSTAARTFDLERGGFQRPPVINWYPYSGAPLTEQETDGTYIYVFGVQSDFRTAFPGAFIESSDASGLCFECVGRLIGSSVLGFVTSTAGMGAGLKGQWDVENSVEVTLLGDGELTSYSRCEVLNGRNLIQIAGEVLAFTTATLVSDRVYTLTEFLRGLMDTDNVTHNVAGENFTFLNSKNRVPVRVDTGDLDVSKIYRVYARSQTPNDNDEITFTVGGETMRPFAPAQMQATRHVPTTNDWSLSWLRVTRNPKPRIFSARGIVDLDPGNYVVEPLDGVGGTPKRTEVVTTEAFVYTEEQQISDFGAAQSLINIQVARTNSIYPDGGNFLEQQFF